MNVEVQQIQTRLCNTPNGWFVGYYLLWRLCYAEIRLHMQRRLSAVSLNESGEAVVKTLIKISSHHLPVGLEEPVLFQVLLVQLKIFKDK